MKYAVLTNTNKEDIILKIRQIQSNYKFDNNVIDYYNKRNSYETFEKILHTYFSLINTNKKIIYFDKYNSVSLTNTFENFYILILSIFKINRNSNLYALKRFIS